MSKKLVLTALGIAVLAIVILLNTPVTVESKEWHVEVVSQKKIGINLDTDKIYFGTLRGGNLASRNITIENSGSRKKFVLTSEGPFSEWLSASKSVFVLDSGESRNVTLTVTVPKDAEPGNYTGRLKISAYRTL